jgi:CBS domain-containing protein
MFLSSSGRVTPTQAKGRLEWGTVAKTLWMMDSVGSTMLSAVCGRGPGPSFEVEILKLSSIPERRSLGLMKITDTIETLLRSTGKNRIFSVTPDQSVYEAIEKMALEGIGAVLVCSEGKLVGILSERDYARKVILKGHASKETPVRDIMTTPVVFVTKQNTVDECMAIMTNRRFRHLPVVENDVPVGVVSIGDLVRWTISGQAQAIQELEGYITGRYPG